MATTAKGRILRWKKEYVSQLTFDETFFAGCKNLSSEIKDSNKVIVPYTNGVADSVFITDGVVTNKAGTDVTNVGGVTFLDAKEIEFTTSKRGFEPFTVLEEDSVELEINLKGELLMERTAKLKEDLAEVVGHGFTTASTANILRSTGTARANVFANASAKALTLNDIRKASLFLDRQKVSKVGRRMLVTPTYFNDLLSLNDINGINAFQPTYDSLIEGKVGRIMGFDVYMTHSLASFTTAVAKKPLQGATDLATDLEAAVFFHPSRMAYGIGATDLKISNTPGTYTSADIVEGWARVTGGAWSDIVSNTTIGSVTLVEGV